MNWTEAISGVVRLRSRDRDVSDGEPGRSGREEQRWLR
jgi:hypothetical protein